MRETYWGYWLFILGVFIIGVMLLVNNISTTNTQDYYNIKEVTQASMIDAVDFSYYRLYGSLKISKEKFVENFTRRFAENLNLSNQYEIGFYDIFEVPPKASVKISTSSNAFHIANTYDNYDIQTTISTILELGASGEGTPDGSSKTSKVRKCNLHIKTGLMQYFQGNHPTQKWYKQNYISLTEQQQQELKEIKTLDEFKSWFMNKYYITGTQTAKEYFANATQDTVRNNSTINFFMGMNWIEIS